MFSLLLAGLLLQSPTFSAPPGPVLGPIIVLPTIADTDWQPVATGDISGENAALYVLWRHAQTGQNIIWVIKQGVLIRAAFLPTVFDLNWKIVGVSSHTGVLWHNVGTGANVLWPLSE